MEFKDFFGEDFAEMDFKWYKKVYLSNMVLNLKILQK